MGLRDIISGRNSRSNKISGIAATEPLRRLKEKLPVQGFLSDYAHALAYATDGLVKSLIDEKDAGVAEYAEIGKNPDKHVRDIERLSAFCAYWLHGRFTARNEHVFENEDGEIDETSRSMAADTNRVLAAMYDISDPTVQRAIALSDDLDSPSQLNRSPGKTAEDHNVLISSLLGIERAHVPIEVETVKYHQNAYRNFLAISAAFISHQDLVATLLETISRQSETK